MKRLLISAAFIISSLINLSALDNKIADYLSFKITPQFEIANGCIKEYVFDPACKNTDNKLSELDWNISTIALFNLHADFDIMRYAYVGLSAAMGVPQRSDYMQDYDWLNSVTADWKDDDPTELTNFSEHINHLDKYITFSAGLGGNLYLPLEFKISPRAIYKYEFIKFTGSNGYSDYKVNNHVKKDFSGKVISYEQTLNTLLLGTNIKVGIIPRTEINLNFDISPNLTFINAIDYHYVNSGSYGTAYLDSFKNLLLMEAGATAQYCFSKNHSTGLCYKIQYIPISHGETSSRVIDKNGNFLTDTWIPVSSGGGGTERFIWSLCLNYSFSL